MIGVNRVDSMPAGDNPFWHDAGRMGTQIGSNVTIMHGGHPNQEQAEIIVVNHTTGERIRVTFGPGGAMGVMNTENGGMPASFEMIVGEDNNTDARRWEQDHTQTARH